MTIELHYGKTNQEAQIPDARLLAVLHPKPFSRNRA